MRMALVLCLLAPGAPSLASDGGFSATVGAFLDSAPRFRAKEPIRTGLPAEIAATLKEDGGYLDFPGVEGAPIWGDDVRLAGLAPTDEEMEQVLADDHGIRLPPGRRIKRFKPGTPREFWDYPVGTRLLHRFLLRTAPPTLTEIRLIEKQPSGRWAYGVYLPQKNGRLRLMKAQEAVTLKVAWRGKKVALTMNRLNPESCRMCHQMHTPVNDYPEEDTAGPCGFGPGNKKLGAWAKDFQAKKGYSPFAN
ncbi:MAG: hypothetical protein HY077_11065 [Elusimicrobia bacterium]|nr:hypothetical protein [Elusimicrobiota bacterium]